MRTLLTYRRKKVHPESGGLRNIFNAPSLLRRCVLLCLLWLNSYHPIHGLDFSSNLLLTSADLSAPLFSELSIDFPGLGGAARYDLWRLGREASPYSMSVLHFDAQPFDLGLTLLSIPELDGLIHRGDNYASFLQFGLFLPLGPMKAGLSVNTVPDFKSITYSTLLGEIGLRSTFKGLTGRAEGWGFKLDLGIESVTGEVGYADLPPLATFKGWGWYALLKRDGFGAFYAQANGEIVSSVSLLDTWLIQGIGKLMIRGAGAWINAKYGLGLIEFGLIAGLGYFTFESAEFAGSQRWYDFTDLTIKEKWQFWNMEQDDFWIAVLRPSLGWGVLPGVRLEISRWIPVPSALTLVSESSDGQRETIVKPSTPSLELSYSNLGTLLLSGLNVSLRWNTDL